MTLLTSRAAGTRVSAAAVLVWFALPALALAQAPQALTGAVNDFANVIDADKEAELETLIKTLMAASGDVIVVATVKTFQPAADIRSYATEMFENQGKGIGQKGRDNGMLVLLAVDDRQVWSEVGYDLEGIITDGFAGETGRQTMAPFFRRGDYGGGLVAGVTRFAQRIAQGRNVTLEGVPVEAPVQPERSVRIPGIVWIFIALIIINALNRRGGGGRRRRWYSHVGPFGVGYGAGWHSRGGSWGGGGGGFGGGFGGFGGGRSGGGGGGASW